MPNEERSSDPVFHRRLTDSHTQEKNPSTVPVDQQSSVNFYKNRSFGSKPRSGSSKRWTICAVQAKDQSCLWPGAHIVSVHTQQAPFRAHSGRRHAQPSLPLSSESPPTRTTPLAAPSAPSASYPTEPTPVHPRGVGSSPAPSVASRHRHSMLSASKLNESAQKLPAPSCPAIDAETSPPVAGDF